MKTRILFVCLGNICRSPLAEALFRQKAEEAGVAHLFEIDSAGTSSQHRGELADHRTRTNARSHGIEITHRSRPFVHDDFENYDIILTMDEQNLNHVNRMSKTEEHLLKVSLLLDMAEGVDLREVPDPWYGGEQGFEEVYQLLDHAAGLLLGSLLKKN